MKTRFMIFVIISVLCFSIVCTSNATATSSGSVLDNMGKVANSLYFQEAYLDVLKYLMDYAKQQTNKPSTNYYNTTPYLDETYCYFNDENNLFYIKFVIFYSSDKTLDNGITYSYKLYFKLSGTRWTQLDEPPIEIEDSDWKVINKYNQVDCYETAIRYINPFNSSSFYVSNSSITYGIGRYIYNIGYTLDGNYHNVKVIVDANTNIIIEEP